MYINTDYLVTDPERWKVIAPFSMTPTEITIHNTYNDATAINEVKNVKNNSTGTSFHVAVDDVGAWQVVPFNRNAWHAGDGTYGAGNRNSIGVEICYSKSGGERYRKAELNAVVLVRQLMRQFNIPASKVKTHQERNGKYCPHRMLDEGRVGRFKSEIAKTEEVVKMFKVQTGGVGFSNLQDLAQAMNNAGMDGQIVIQKDGLGYAVTNAYPAGNMDKFTAWLDGKGWWYQYIN
ncbi:N-acetylmuramoyl-L-alanine amidase [Bacillus phage Anath]|uniref:N-acetylmuramoyl-L-alanine amidase n=1 Tax=Bacillus phage Anath TaxID=2108114 RepID=A0A2P1JUJ2_9CAUD|nr:N-acetylmuramoyl-L-alanine amidase [Bacillus phage Anath]